jgi:hypothetical protein
MIESMDWNSSRGFWILGLTHGIASNNPDLIFNPVHFEAGEIYTQITNWEKLQPVEYGPGMDSYCHLVDKPGADCQISFDENILKIEGDLSKLERNGQDKRWNIFGNIGIWFRHVLAIQERHGIYSLHASSIYKPEVNELMIIAGKAGTGKTVYLLESILRGYQIFSTELTFFQLTEKGIVFYRGALMDNIRVGSFIYDFPDVANVLGIDLPQCENPWDYKINVDMHQVSTESKTLLNPRLSFIFPRIESGYTHAIVHDIPQPRVLTRLLFEVASEKIGSTFLMYEELPAVGLDNNQLVKNRFRAIRELVEAPKWQIKQARNILAGPKSCMEVVDE